MTPAERSALIQKLVQRAPALDGEQRAHLRALLQPRRTSRTVREA